MRQTERGGTERTGQLGAFLLALALLLVLTVFAHRVVLGWRRSLQGRTCRPDRSLPEPESHAGDSPGRDTGQHCLRARPGVCPRAAAPANTGMESYLAALEADDARPADAGAVQEKTYPHGSGEKYIPCGGGHVSKTTPVSRRQTWRRKSQTLCPLR